LRRVVENALAGLAATALLYAAPFLGIHLPFTAEPLFIFVIAPAAAFVGFAVGAVLNGRPWARRKTRRLAIGVGAIIAGLILIVTYYFMASKPISPSVTFFAAEVAVFFAGIGSIFGAVRLLVALDGPP